MDQGKTGRLIAALRKENGMTQKALAEQLGVTDRAVSKWENGRGLPDLELLLPLCAQLGCTAEEILLGERLTGESGKEEELRREYERLLTGKRRQRKFVRGAVAASVVCCLLLAGILACNKTFWRSSYQSECCDNVQIAIPRFSVYRSEGGLDTYLVKLKTLRQPDGVEVFIDSYLAGLEPVKGESGTYYYNKAKDFTIWQYGINNDGVGFVNTIYIGYVDGYYDGTI